MWFYNLLLCIIKWPTDEDEDLLTVHQTGPTCMMHNRFIGYNDFDVNNDHSRSAQDQNHKPASRKLQPTRHNFGIFIKEMLNLWGECRKTCFTMSKSGRKRMLTCFVVAIVFPPKNHCKWQVYLPKWILQSFEKCTTCMSTQACLSKCMKPFFSPSLTHTFSLPVNFASHLHTDCL